MSNRTTRRRSVILRLVFSLVFTVFLVRLFSVQHAYAFLKQWSKSEWYTQSIIKPMRGSIYDSNGDQLAFDVPAYNLDMDIQDLASRGKAFVAKIANRLSPVLGVSASAITAQIERKDVAWLRWYPTMVNLTLAKKNAVVKVFQALNVSQDVNPNKTYLRVYPAGTFASHVLGFVDQTGTGVAGTELEYNRYLAGKPGMRTFVSDAAGNPIPFKPVVTKPVQNGDNVYLTLNASIQQSVDQALARIQKRFHPAHAAIIVADPWTGAILGMGALPSFNPNTYWKYPASTLDTNWAISDPFEPGSTFKIVTLTGALATHAINLNQTYMSGVDYVDGVPIHDWNIWGWGRITYREAMIVSSNVGFIHIGQAEGPMTLAHYIALYGMNKPTGIDLPGEGTSILFDPKHINPVDFATTTFGQGLAVTPIQQVAEVGAVANGGLLMKPYVVQKIVSPSGRVVYYRKPDVVRRVAAKSIMNMITNVMVQDVSQDPTLSAYVPGYDVAGKTGTAQIPSPKGGYYANKYNLSFIGFAPANHPAIDIYVTVSEPHHAIQYGNDVSSPQAKIIIGQSLRALRVPPVGASPNSPFAQVSLTSFRTVPNLRGMNIAEATAELTRLGLHPDVIDSSGRVIRQWPAAGQRVASGSAVAFASNQSVAKAGSVRVPNFSGVPMQEAVNLCAILGLTLEPSGSGYASAQSIKPGTVTPIGSVITVKFTPALSLGGN
ncbi:penicillin-binding transpeptidase domain-containing protein [Ferroacidibacillus organovorans]|uniref:penicillin-binding transpeptidase domain-containing protein n=1 Tax=Ferroacidibacillus organovorans TaxID=1765683 RepID=UPI000829F25F|nr:penicillin-binding transpeptidase domain-containing protein [Ferroacidibacillus organovorans]